MERLSCLGNNSTIRSTSFQQQFYVLHRNYVNDFFFLRQMNQNNYKHEHFTILNVKSVVTTNLLDRLVWIVRVSSTGAGKELKDKRVFRVGNESRPLVQEWRDVAGADYHFCIDQIFWVGYNKRMLK